MFKRSLASIELEQIARQLSSVRRANGLKTALVLGSRAGGLFRRSALQYLVQALAPPEIQAASYYEQFAECFRQLTRAEGLSTNEQYALLTGALEYVTPSEADRCLAQLIIQGYFDPIITTGADTLLEQALMEAGWRLLHNFEVINLTTRIDERMLAGGRRSVCTVLRVFGSLTSQDYVLSSRYAHTGNILHQQVLAQILRRDCLIIGFDKVWDESLYYLFPPHGDTCWLIAEEADERFYVLKETRNILLMHENYCVDYETFFVRLYDMLIDNAPIDATRRADKPASAVTSRTPTKEQQQQKALEVFISYHESDEVYLNSLIEHMANLKREGLVKDWFKGKIQAGQAIAEVTQHYLERSTVFLLLVSPSFVASDALYQELQQMMERHQARKALVIPILIRPVDWESMSLRKLASLPSNGLFVTQWSNYDSAFLNIAQGIRQALTEYGAI
jgi:hypothetical protein